MHNCKGAGLSRSESGTFYLYTVIILLSSCFFIPTAVLFYKPAVRSSLPCAHNSSGSVGDRIQIIPPSIDELPSSADLLPVIPACAAFPHYLLSVIYSFTRRFSVHFICTTMFAKPLVFFFQSIFAMSLHAHCFRPPYASSAAALSCVHFLLLKYIIHFPAIEKWFLNASFDMVRRTHDMHGQSSAPQDSCCPQMADLVQQRNQYKKECALAHSRASRGRLRQSTSSRECASLAR